MNYPSDSDLAIDYFKNSALSYFQYGNSLVISNGIYEINGENKVFRYPIKLPELDYRVKLQRHHYIFWNIIGKYTPNGTYISNAYVSPSDQAVIGLSMLEEKIPGVSLSTYKDIQTNPELIGKYSSDYLFEFNYNKIQNVLSSFGISWSKPNASVHQRGLAIDLHVVDSYYSELVSITEWFKSNNPDLNITNLIKQDSNTLHIEFSEKVLTSSSIPGNTFLLNHSFGSGISSALNGKESVFYDILKANGHKDLEDCGLPTSMLSKLPDTAKRQNYFLAKAIKEMLESSLGGQNGIISELVQSELEYVLSVANGAVGALLRIGTELDTLTEGRASSLIRDAIESEGIKTTNNNIVKTKLKQFIPIYSEDYPGLNIAPDKDTYAANLSTKKLEVSTSLSNIADTFKDTKNTPNNNDTAYDNLRTNSPDAIVTLTYDHYLTVDNNYIDYYELKKSSTYVENLFNVTYVTIKHNLNKTVSVNAYDMNGTAAYGVYTVVDSNTVTATFTSSFTGKIIIS